MLTEQQFIKRAKTAIILAESELENINHTYELLQIVWMTHVLGNKKALFIDHGRFLHGEYFEVTYNREKDEFYVDKYTKGYNTVRTSKELSE